VSLSSSANHHVLHSKESHQKSNVLQSVILQEIYAEKIVVQLVDKHVKQEDNVKSNAKLNLKTKSQNHVPRMLYHSVKEIALQSVIRNVQ
jgi:hypothetical protein